MIMSYINIAIKLALGLLSIVMVINFTGKGNLAPSSASDQVQNYVLGGIIGGVIYNSSVRILDFIAILCIWCILVLGLKWIKTHNVKAKQLIDGKALTIIDGGKIIVENCKKAGLSAHDVSFKLRTNGIYSTKDVKRAVLEQNGQLIVVRMGDENPKYPIITDGVVQVEILETIGKSEEWLTEKLKEEGFEEVSNIFIAEYDKGQLNVVTY